MTTSPTTPDDNTKPPWIHDINTSNPRIPTCLYSKEYQLIFYTSEKSNCTEIVEIFFKTCGIAQEQYTPGIDIHRYKWSTYIPNHPTYLSDLTSPSCHETLKIKFIRCPYERAVSIYAHIVHFQLFQFNEKATFYQILQYLQHKEVRRGYNGIDPHAQTQTNLYLDQFAWDEIVHIEHMKQELQSIHQRRSCHLIYQEEFESDHWTRGPPVSIELGKYWNVPFKMAKYHYNYANFYNSLTKQLVETIYQLDFANHPEYTFQWFIQRNTNPVN